MAEIDGQEKTEQASGKKLSESRDRGQVAKSMEINSFAVFTSGLLLLFMTQSHIGNNISELSIKLFGELDKLQLEKDLIQDYAIKGISFFFITVAPVFAGLIIIALIATYGQIGFKITPKALFPKMSKFNPLTNIKSMFFSTKSLIEVSKSLVKLVVIGIFTYWLLADIVYTSRGLVEYSVEEIVSYMIDSAYSLLWKLGLFYAVIAAADFAYQRFHFKKEMMMTKQEVKEEHKQTEGDPYIKSKIKSAQMSMARRRMFKELPTADVVITNPTHFAVALKYDVGKSSAPKVIAKGMDELAQKIKKVAAENNIPLHEDRELARSLYRMCEVGDEIPASLFKAVAQILAYIFKLRDNKKRKSII